MKTKVVFRKENNKQNKRFEITQTHWFYFLPSFMINGIIAVIEEDHLYDHSNIIDWLKSLKDRMKGE